MKKLPEEFWHKVIAFTIFLLLWGIIAFAMLTDSFSDQPATMPWG